MEFNIILASDDRFGVGKQNTLPWKGLPIASADMKWFQQITTQSHTAVIMGRKTWDSLPSNAKPLPKRVNIVLSRDQHQSSSDPNMNFSLDQIQHAQSLNQALDFCKSIGAEEVFVIGGAQVYNEAFAHPLCKRIYVTDIPGDFDCDAHIDQNLISKNYQVVEHKSLTFGAYYFDAAVKVFERLNVKNPFIFRISTYIYNPNPDEVKYLELLKELINAPERDNRTGTPTRGLFAQTLRFSLSDGPFRVFPLITTKFTAYKSIYYELIWFLKGSTNTDFLKANNITIWDDNSTRQFLDKRGLTDYKEGEVGEIYGSQWRNWNGVGIDQLRDVIDRIKVDPMDRRLVVSAWNPEKIPKMALPPCHTNFQFYVSVDADKRPSALNCIVHMRSADVALGVPFNIASYALLVHMISLIVDIPPGELVIVMADCHIYVDHIPGVKTQLSRHPRSFPRLEFGKEIMKKKLTSGVDIDDFTNVFAYEDTQIMDYYPHPAIKLKMAV